MNLVMGTFGRAVKPLFGTGVGKLPMVSRTYKWLWRTLGPSGIIDTTANGYVISVDSKDWAVAPSLAFSHVWEPRETEVVKRFVKPGMIFVDIGAHVGYYSLLASGLVGASGKVCAFEPSPDTRALLTKNLSRSLATNVRVLPYAISGYNGRANIYADATSPASNTMWSTEHKNPLRVEARTLDSQMGPLVVDFIKMDIEGNEVNALRGMTEVIKRSPKLLMLTEIYPAGLEAAGSSVEEYVEHLSRYFTLRFTETHNGWLHEPATLEKIKRRTNQAGSINLLCLRLRSAQ